MYMFYYVYSIGEPTGGFPLHQYAMNGNVEGVMTCANSGLSVNDKDDESWAPLHYACWYVILHNYVPYIGKSLR